MPQRTISAFRPTGIAIGKHFYSDDDVDEIVLAAGGLPDGKVAHERANDDGTGFVTVHVDRRTALAERLETAAQWWHANSQWQVKPTAKQRADAFKKIETAADRLLGAMRLPGQPDESDVLRPMPNAVRFGGLQAFAAKEAERLGGFPEQAGEDLLEGYVWGVYRLRDWARAARQRYASRRATPRDKRHTGDTALDELFGNLAGIWANIFNGYIGTSVGAINGHAGGPFVRFIEACLQPLLGDDTPPAKAIQRRIQQLFPPRKST